MTRIPLEVQRLLAAEGLIPTQCRSVEMSISPTGPVIMRYETWLTPEQLGKFALVFTKWKEILETAERERLERVERARAASER